MKYLIKFFLVFFVLQTNSFAKTPSDALNVLLKEITSMEADFNQSIVGKDGKEIGKSNGKMSLKRPGKFRWETLAPNKQLIIAAGSRLSIYDQDLQQVVIRSLTTQAGATPSLLLSDANPAIDTDYYVRLDKSSTSDAPIYILIPIDQGSMYASIRMEFKNKQLQQMILQDRLDHKTIIQFSNIKSNISLADANFYFAPPKNVDVIDETK